jgi:hypothetical protein
LGGAAAGALALSGAALTFRGRQQLVFRGGDDLVRQGRNNNRIALAMNGEARPGSTLKDRVGVRPIHIESRSHLNVQVDKQRIRTMG